MPYNTAEKRNAYRRKYYQNNKEKFVVVKCPHNKNKSICKDCGGSGICSHDKNIKICKECGGSSLCPHNIQKQYCKECGGSGICEHKIERRHCKVCNICLYLIKLQRSRISHIMKNYNIIKTKSSIEYLDCSSEYFKSYIESKFVEGMTFDNIHYDHIKPISKFNFEDPEELLKCCHYTNFQPLLIADNLEKHNKWTDEDDLFWNENIIYKEYLPLYIPKH